MKYVKLPTRFLYSRGREEFAIVMAWMRTIGEQEKDWHYFAISHELEFVHDEDLTAFKIRFGI